MARHCNDFSSAQAGRGLPVIEPGMPAPAGTGLTRRSLLLKGAGLALSVYGASKLPLQALEAGVAEASAGTQGRVLVSIFLSGGLDGMSVLAPTGDARYAALRPTLKLEAGSGLPFADDPGLEWSPDARGLATLHGEGKVAVAPAVGYAGPDQSHFTSRHYWEVGATDTSSRLGWLGRFLDQHGDAGNPLQGLSLGATLSPALAAATVPVSAVSRPDDYGLWDYRAGAETPQQQMLAAIGRLGAMPTNDPARRKASAVATQVDSVRQALKPFQGGITAPVSYPDGEFGIRLKGLAAMLDAGVPVRAVSIDGPGGYDTHADQAQTLSRDLTDLGDGVLAFQRDLEARGLQDRVVTMVWSEFGRRPEQNTTGTDHGAAGLGLLIGNRVKGGLLGEFPGLGQLDPNGNLRTTLDFRSVYRGLLEQWYGVDAAPILPGASGFAAPTLLR